MTSDFAEEMKWTEIIQGNNDPLLYQHIRVAMSKLDIGSELGESGP